MIFISKFMFQQNATINQPTNHLINHSLYPFNFKHNDTEQTVKCIHTHTDSIA